MQAESKEGFFFWPIQDVFFIFKMSEILEEVENADFNQFGNLQ